MHGEVVQPYDEMFLVSLLVGASPDIWSGVLEYMDFASRGKLELLSSRRAGEANWLRCILPRLYLKLDRGAPMNPNFDDKLK